MIKNISVRKRRGKETEQSKNVRLELWKVLLGIPHDITLIHRGGGVLGQKEFSETPFERFKRLEKSANQFKTKDELEENISELKQILEQNKKNYKEFGKYLPSYDRDMARGRNWGLQKTIEQKEAYLNNWDKIKQEEKNKRRKDNLKTLGYAGAAMVAAPIIGIGVNKLLS